MWWGSVVGRCSYGHAPRPGQGMGGVAIASPKLLSRQKKFWTLSGRRRCSHHTRRRSEVPLPTLFPTPSRPARRYPRTSFCFTSREEVLCCLDTFFDSIVLYSFAFLYTVTSPATGSKQHQRCLLPLRRKRGSRTRLGSSGPVCACSPFTRRIGSIANCLKGSAGIAELMMFHPVRTTPDTRTTRPLWRT